MFRFGLDEIQENTFVILILLLSCKYGQILTVKLLNNSQVCKSTQYEINIISFRLDMYKE